MPPLAPNDTPAVRALRARSRSDAAGYAALLDLLTRPAPDALFRAEPPPLADDAAFHLHERGHVRYRTETAESAAVICRDGVAALHALLSTAEAAQFLSVDEGYCLPTWHRTAARLGLRPPAAQQPRLAQHARPGETVNRCGVTDRLFALSATAPVPCIVYTDVDEFGQDPLRDAADPRDRNPRHLDLHPQIAARGRTAVLSALWGRLRADMEAIREGLYATAQLASMLGGMEPDDLGGPDLPKALMRQRSVRLDGGGAEVSLEPNGWRDVGRA